MSEPIYSIDKPDAIVAGKSISDWTADWWKWILQGPQDPFNPVDDKTGLLAYQDNSRPVFFLAGTNGVTGSGGNAERYIVVPHGKPVLVPMVNYFDTLDPKDVEDANVSAFAAAAQPFAKIDGNDVLHPTDFLETTGVFSLGQEKPGTLVHQLAAQFGVSKIGQELAPTEATGYYLMLEGLSRGTHTLTFGGSAPGFSGSVTDHLIVV